MFRPFAALALIVATATAAPAASLVVPFGDLNPANPADLATLQARVHAAAEKVCLQVERQDHGTGYVDTLRERRTCIARASDRGMARAREVIARQGSKVAVLDGI
jgi:UrcA family protein